MKILARSFLFLAWTALVGWAPAATIGAGFPLWMAPFFGVALFGVFAETGGAFHVRPSSMAALLTLLSLLTLVALALARRLRFQRPSRALLLLAVFATSFAFVGSLPLASHGEGAVLGLIDDASRECVVADSISIYGWKIPPDVEGYFVSMRYQIEIHHVRHGGIYLLSALADAFGTRAHEVYSVAMLATGFLVVWGAGVLACTIARRHARRWWLAPALVAVNSILLTTLYGQHLGSLLGAALMISFLAFSLRLASTGRCRTVVSVALLVAAGLVFYPEAMAVWVVTAVLALATVKGWKRRKRAAASLALAFCFGCAMNPVATVRAVRFVWGETHKFATPSDRMMTGDTHYFPSPTVIWGIEAYREDAPPPVGAARRVVICAAVVLILLTALLGWTQLLRREKAVILALFLPVALALVANAGLRFPYGYAKFLPMAAAIWSVAFAFLAARAMEKPASPAHSNVPGAVALAALALAFPLAVPSAGHVLRRGLRSAPAYDPAYRVLPALARPVGPGSVIVVDEPNVASREWMRYFLADNAVIDRSSTLPPWASRSYLLIDRRKTPGVVTGPAIVTSRDFALVYWK